MVEFDKPGDCPAGIDCPTHFRVNLVQRNNEDFQINMVTYVGEYCVMTGDNPVHMHNPGPAIMSMLSTGRLPDDIFATSVFRVGRMGTLYDIATSGAPIIAEQSFPSGNLDAAEANHEIA